MKKLLTLIISLSLISLSASAQENDKVLLLTGASFASPANTWFETGCELLGATPINRAVGGQSIMTAAGLMNEDKLYSREELEVMDALVIMQVHDRDVFVSNDFASDKRWEDYAFPMTGGDYAGGFDYVIKRYIADCYRLKDDPDSGYYGSKSGKPAVIVLCTHWHDARPTYNESVRKLAGKWGLAVVEFDVNIGFSRFSLHPVTGEQISLLYSTDTQTMDGQLHGWHPIRGKESYIQRRMAAIFVHKMRQILP